MLFMFILCTLPDWARAPDVLGKYRKLMLSIRQGLEASGMPNHPCFHHECQRLVRLRGVCNFRWQIVS